MHTSTDIPTIEPTGFTAGETVKWTKELSHYDPASYSLTYHVNGPLSRSYTATASGSSFAVTISAADTAAWTPGDYWWTARVSKDGEVFTVGSGRWTVKPDPTQQSDGYDGRSKAKQILDAHETAYLAYASRIEKQYSLGAAGRSFVYHDKAELIAAIDYWKSIVAQETAAEKIARGENSGNHILVRFK